MPPPASVFKRAQSRTPPPTLDFAVIGAGPSGLATALGLKRSFPQARIQVFDKARTLRPIGAAVTIQGNGQAALGAISPEALAELKKQALDVKGFQVRDAANQVVASQAAVPNGTTQTVDNLIIISWFGLQQILLSALGHTYLQLNKALTHLEQCEETGVVTLSFKDGSQATAHCVIGADGNASATRAALFPDEPEPAYAGGAVWRTMVRPVPENFDLQPGWVALWNSEQRRVGVRNFGDHLSVAALATWPEERLQEMKRRVYYGETPTESQAASDKNKLTALVDRAREVLSTGIPPSLSTLILDADPRTLIEHGVFWRDPEQPWVKGHVALIGDAAHVMPPPLGQGTALAFEDAYWVVASLVDTLTSHTPHCTPDTALHTLRAPPHHISTSNGNGNRNGNRTHKGSNSVVEVALRAYENKMKPRIGLLSRHSITLENTATLKVPEHPADATELNGKTVSEYLQMVRQGVLAPLAPIGDMATVCVTTPTEVAAKV